MPLIEEYTGFLDGIVESTIEYRFATYGNTSNQSLNDMQQSFINHAYIHTDPIANVFNVIHKY